MNAATTSPHGNLRLLGVLMTCSTTGGRGLFRRTTLERIDLAHVESAGYVFQADLALRTLKAGLRVVEVPIEFVERERGDSKMSRRIASESFQRITRWGLAERIRQVRAALDGRRGASRRRAGHHGGQDGKEQPPAPRR